MKTLGVGGSSSGFQPQEDNQDNDEWSKPLGFESSIHFCIPIQETHP